MKPRRLARRITHYAKQREQVIVVVTAVRKKIRRDLVFLKTKSFLRARAGGRGPPKWP
jgi:hypothetical protein